MPLITDLNLAGRNLGTYGDYLQGQSALIATVAAAGGQVNIRGDFREQVFPVISRSALITPVAAETNKPSVDPAGTNARFDVLKWPEFTPIPEEDDANLDPADLVQTAIGGVVAILPQSFDDYYMKRIANGANVTEVVFNPTAGVASLKAVEDFFTDKTYGLTGGILTRKGSVELGYNVDGNNMRDDLRNTISAPTNVTNADFSLSGGSTNRVLGIYGPFDASRVVAAQGLMVDRMEQATVAAKGPENGFVNWRTQAAQGHGNAYSTQNDKTDTGDGFVVLTIA